ncbi:hypothetical protein DFJ77DRAFT_171296 [Powellomyces hirtus]|nr:hypothetical protein DFJ77DRAFT_171296 [Powellomyces hirtus]
MLGIRTARDKRLALIGKVQDVLANDANFKFIRKKEVAHRPTGHLLNVVLVTFKPDTTVDLEYDTTGKTKLFGARNGNKDRSYSLSRLLLKDHRDGVFRQLGDLRNRINLPFRAFHPSYKAVTPFETRSLDGTRNLFPGGCYRIHVVPPVVYETVSGAKIATNYILACGETGWWNLFYDHDDEILRASDHSARPKNAIIHFNKTPNSSVNSRNVGAIFRNIWSGHSISSRSTASPARSSGRKSMPKPSRLSSQMPMSCPLQYVRHWMFNARVPVRARPSYQTERAGLPPTTAGNLSAVPLAVLLNNHYYFGSTTPGFTICHRPLRLTLSSRLPPTWLRFPWFWVPSGSGCLERQQDFPECTVVYIVLSSNMYIVSVEVPRARSRFSSS